jgi:hypothetical protein
VSVQINPKHESEVQISTPSKPYSPNHTSTIRSPNTIADTARDAVDRGQAAVSHPSDTASETAETATRQVKTFASELEAMAKRNPLG